MKLVNGRILGLLNCEMFSVGKIAVAIHGFFPGIEKQRLPTILYNNHWQMIPPKKEVFILYPNAIVDFFMWVSNLFICVTMTLEWCSQFVPLKQVLWLVEIDAFIGGGGGGRQQSHSGKLILLFLSQDVTLVWEVICQVRLFSHEEPLPLQAARGSAAVAAREPPTHLPVSKVCCFFCWFSVWPRWKSCPYGKLTIASLWKVCNNHCIRWIMVLVTESQFFAGGSLDILRAFQQLHVVGTFYRIVWFLRVLLHHQE